MVISGRPAITDPSQRFGSTYVTIFGPNPEPEYVKAYGIKLNDSEALSGNSMFKRLRDAASFALRDAINEMIQAGRANNTIKLEEVLRSILSADNDNTTIPLFRAIKGHFQIEPIATTNKYGQTSTGINVAYFGKKGIERFRFYSKDFKGNSFRSDIYVKDERTGKRVLNAVSIDSNNENKIANWSASSFIEFLQDKVNFNISLQGVASDNLDNHMSKGFIRKVNGKLIVDIPSKHPFYEEFDSYNDFVVNNNLIRVNTKKSKNGTNFEKFGENQVGNATISVSLPISNVSAENVIPSANTKQLPPNVKIEILSSKEEYDRIVDVFDGKPINGVELVKNILTDEKIQEFAKATEEEQLAFNDLFDIEVEYDSRINDYRKENNINRQPLAITSGDNENATFKWYDEKGNVHESKLKNKNRVLVGPRFVNRAASKIYIGKNNAIKLILHEKIHNIIQSKEKRSIDLLKALEEVYTEFIESVNDKVNFDDLTEKEKEKIELIKNVFEEYRGSSEALLARIQSGQVTNRTETTYRHTEEFLVETLTNEVLYNYLNSVYTNAISNENAQNKDNLLMRIFRAIAKFFGWESANDNTLLMKQFNVVRDFFNESNNTEKVENNTEIEDNIQENENLNEIDNVEEEVIEEASDEDEYYDEDDLSNFAVIDDSYIDTDMIPVHNIDAFKNSLPLSIQSDFATSVQRGEFEMACK